MHCALKQLNSTKLNAIKITLGWYKCAHTTDLIPRKNSKIFEMESFMDQFTVASVFIRTIEA